MVSDSREKKPAADCHSSWVNRRSAWVRSDLSGGSGHQLDWTDLTSVLDALPLTKNENKLL